MKTRLATLVLAMILAVVAAMTTRVSLAQGLPDCFTSLTLSYCDIDVACTVTITNQGTDDGINGSNITVNLKQGENEFEGLGFMRQVEPRVYLLAFSLPAPDSAFALFDGVL